ncbi:NADPH-dependent F420 reductase [Methanobrevibacter boviskoreani]|uniref:NADPH-dependent F420 reductase n=1 Tax=Methanobrevibacter boviskoreani TaxID=1348249 RepID=UPI0023A90120|nr:NADPH-dependent F420 reductase [Methanobrevibacter boviskoreani]MCI6774868.1 NADPH-dependent F420 reductase [Methanobrevibacter boviskoreani]MCI6931497.1 NADPH-dependent F420 reductase [Methanobrevibacter boviskoreani]MDD6257140.1 NADPH-dependent F420 reductase [Methanobrevibacter boviskoreani]MDY5614633.1 NADPH-dependent F420 reductase [Methanobrevibacter boviskoreani]
MVISVIGGTGPQGLGIAKRLAIAGESVIVGSRKEEKAVNIVKETIEELKDYDVDIKGMANEDAANNGNILIITVPLQAQSATLKTIKPYVKGKIILDATVPLETAIGGKVSRLLKLPEGSAAERTASLLDGEDVKVVAAFNNISNSLLLNITEPIDCDCIIAGDDQEAKDIASELIGKIPGIRVIDAGALEKSQLIEAVTPLLIGLNIKYKSKYGGFRITGIPNLDD